MRCNSATCLIDIVCLLCEKLVFCNCIIVVYWIFVLLGRELFSCLCLVLYFWCSACKISGRYFLSRGEYVTM